MRFSKKYLAARYLRLSREDGDKMESDSISNQRQMIEEYLQKHPEIEFVKEYVDDGFSGANYDRPSFKKMIEDVKRGKVNCIIVKDLSRLGRNYIETGRYLEKIFPVLGVRVLALLDNYDSFSKDDGSEEIIVPFKNLINDAYCRDMSTKIRSQFEVKRRKGQYIGSFACFGYKKDPADNNHLVIDPYAADIVRQIYRWKLDGFNSQRIAEQLNKMGVLPPAEYKRSKGMNYDCGFRGGDNPAWQVVTVNRVLTNEIYTGTMVQGMSQKISYRIKQSRPIPKEEWIRVEGTHEAIIPRSIFERVQELLEIDTRTAPEEDSVYLLSGLVLCGDCGQNMVRRTTRKKEKVYYYFHCSTYKNKLGCSSHLISVKKLEEVVLATIKHYIEMLIEAENILKQIDRIPEEQCGVKVVTRQIETLDTEIQRYRNMKVQAYTDMLDEFITKDEYQDITRKFTTRIEAAKKNKEGLLQKKQRMMANKIYLQPWMESFRKYQNVETLDRQMVLILIRRIVVYSKDKIHIQFQYEEEMQEMFAVAGIGSPKAEGGMKCV